MSTLKFHWYLPTHGDSRYIGDSINRADGPGIDQSRPPSIPYLGQIARSAEQLGFEAALTPTGTWCSDAWITTAMLAGVTESLKFLVAFRPGLLSPYLAAQQTGTFQNLSGGRVLLNIVTGAEDSEQRAYGDFIGKDDRYERTGEFLNIVRRLWRGETVTFSGKHLSVENATLQQIPDPTPDVYFGGSSPAALPVAAEYADVYLTWGEPPAQVAEKIDRVRQLAEELGRTLRFGIRVHSIARDTADEAWTEADRLLAGMSDEQIEHAQAAFRTSQSVGQQRMLSLNRGSRDGLQVYPNLWAGVGLVRGGAGTALVGSYAQIADLIEEYAAVGITEFVLSGYPHLEEAYWFGEGVLPELARRGLWHPVTAGSPTDRGTPVAPAREPVPAS
jgi:alkanesulfonate monooxygenase